MSRVERVLVWTALIVLAWAIAVGFGFGLLWLLERSLSAVGG